MSAVTDTPTTTLAPVARGGLLGSVHDSLVVAKRNLLRMMRIPNRVGSSPLGSIPLRTLKELVK